MAATIRQHLPLLILIAIFVILTQLYAAAVPPFEGPDEAEHFAYAAHLMTEHRLPDPERDSDTMIRQAVAQNPLYYFTVALWTAPRQFDLDHVTEDQFKVNPWGLYPSPVTSRDNRNHYLMEPTQHVMTADQRELSAANRWMRRITALFGVLALLGVYSSARAIWPRDKSWAVFAALVYAMHPTLIQTFALLSNDAAVIGFGMCCLAAALHLYRQPDNRWLWILNGVLLGFAALSKTSGLSFLALPALALMLNPLSKSLSRKQERDLPDPLSPACGGELERGFLVARESRRGGTLQQIALALLVIWGIAAIIAGWWYVRGWIQYGDPMGMEPHLDQPWAYDPPQPITKVLDRLPIITITLWANMGSGEVRPGLWGKLLPLALLILSLIGWSWLLIQRRIHHDMLPYLLMLLATVMIGFAALLRWMSLFDQITGRLFFPFYGAVVLLLLIGLYAFRNLKTIIAGLMGGMAVLIVPIVIMSAFGAPALYDTLPDNITPVHIPYANGAYFAGHSVDRDEIAPGIEREFTLCWGAESGEQNVEQPHPFALHILNPERELVGKRESYPGLGSYTLWRPDKIFCDTFFLNIGANVEPGQVYPIVISLFDVVSGVPIARTDNSETSTVIGYLRAPAPPVYTAALENAPFRFEGVALVDYRINVDSILMTWGTFSAPGKEYRLFVHLYNEAGERVAQVDPVPGGERYPIWTWGAGEQIENTVALPLDGLAPGTYTIRIGLYDPQTFLRIRVTDSAGNTLPEETAELGSVTVPE